MTTDRKHWGYDAFALREYLIKIDNAPVQGILLPLNITGLSSYHFGQGIVSLEVYGSGFSATDSIYIKKDGSIIEPIKKNFDQNNSKWLVAFDLSQAEEGQWEFFAENIFGAVPAPKKLEISSLEDGYDLELKIIGGNQIRAGRWRPIVIEITNKTNKDAFFVPVTVTFEGYPEIKNDVLSDFPDYLTETVQGDNWDAFGPDYNNWEDFEVFFDYFDTLSNTNLRVVPVFFQQVKANSTATITLDVKYQNFGNTKIISNLLAPAIYNENGIRGSLPEGCIDALLGSGGVVAAVALSSYAAQPLSCLAGISNVIYNSNYTGTAISGVAIAVAAASAIASCATTIAIVANPAAHMATGIVSAMANAGSIGSALASAYESCKNSSISEVTVVGSSTPEDKYGITGAEQIDGLAPSERKNFIHDIREFSYKIEYWNKEDATAPAAEVFIRDTLDVHFNLETFNFTEIGFLRWQIPLDGGHYFNVNVDMRPDYNYIVNVEGTLNPFTREVYWIHRTLDPETLDLPDDPQAGYLPPIDPEGYFIGWVNFSVSPFDSLASGTVFENQARVNFDGIGPWGPAPPYGPYKNTYDFDAPESQILPATIQVNDTTLLVSWSGNDGDGCGIGLYDIYASKNSDPFEVWLRRTPQTSGEFIGEAGYEYCFYSIAIDKVGNTEETPDSPDYCAQISSAKERLSSGYELFQNAPNPFGNKTTIGFKIPTTQNVKILAYNQLGYFEIIVDGKFPEGIHQVDWTPKNSSPSIYFYQMITSDFTDTKKMIFHK
ncbi:MAG: hypothetical protein WA004_13310 [Saprospiraceae bacterium]